MADLRHKDAKWNIGAEPTVDQAQLGLLMDIRDELKRSNRLTEQLLSLVNCYRIPRALDAMAEMGADMRRKKRLQAVKAKKRKAAHT